MKVGHLVQILRSEDGKAVGGGDESRKQGSSKWLMDMVMWNLENSLRKDMITVCFLVHSFIHASTPTSFGSNVISISTTTTLVKLSLQPSALLIHLPLPYFFFFFFFSIYHLSIYYTVLLFIMFNLGFSPQNCKPGRDPGVFWSPLCSSI